MKTLTLKLSQVMNETKGIASATILNSSDLINSVTGDQRFELQLFHGIDGGIGNPQGHAVVKIKDNTGAVVWEFSGGLHDVPAVQMKMADSITVSSVVGNVLMIAPDKFSGVGGTIESNIFGKVQGSNLYTASATVVDTTNAFIDYGTGQRKIQLLGNGTSTTSLKFTCE